MIEFVKGDLFESGCEALVNPVNCVGISGKGLALEFKKRFPANFDAYAHACKQRNIGPGLPFVFDTGTASYPWYIVNFPTKRHWREASQLGDIESGLKALKGIIRQRMIESIALVPLGCGLGGLSWDDVRPLIALILADSPGVRIAVYEP